MGSFFSFLLKTLLILVALIVVSQLEYNGRKIQTYFVESFKSKPVNNSIEYVKSKVTGDEHKQYKTANVMEDIDEKDQKELQNLMD